LKHQSKLKAQGPPPLSTERDELILTSPTVPCKKSLSKLKRAHPEEEKIMELTAEKLGYWRSEIEFFDLEVRFTPPSPFWHYPVSFYNREYTFKDNLMFLLIKHNIISSLDILKPHHIGHPGGFSLFF
jgi:hypothetical protein